MQVEQVASKSGLSIDTIRYYQKLGLLHSPKRSGRVAEYDDSHLKRLAEIQHLSAAGFTLAQIGRLGQQDVSHSDPLLQALRDGDNNEAAGDDSLSLAQLAEASGLDQNVCELALAAGLITAIGDPAADAADLRFSPSAAEMLKVGLQLLEAGIPLEDLLALASFHATNIDKVAELAVSLFADYLLPSNTDATPEADSDADPDTDTPADSSAADSSVADSSSTAPDLGDLVERLVPLVTNLVAQHFQRTLVDKATQKFIEKEAAREANREATKEPEKEAAAPATLVLRRWQVESELDPLAAFATATDYQRAYWTVPDDDLQIAAIGVAVTLPVSPSQPVLPSQPISSNQPISPGQDSKNRFAVVDEAMRQLNVSVEGETGPAITGPLLLGGFSFAEFAEEVGFAEEMEFAEEAAAIDRAHEQVDHSQPDESSVQPDELLVQPDWSAFGAGELTLPEILIVRTDGKTFVTAETGAVDRARELVTRSLAQQSLDQQSRASAPPTQSSSTQAPPSDQLTNDPAYLRLVTQALTDIDNQLFTKVVTARTLKQPCSVSAPVLLDRLRQCYQSCAIFAFSRGDQTFLGASPELLVQLEDAQVKTDALAGSRPRSDEPAQDSALSVELLTSAKERAEHRLVAQAIREALTDAGVKLAAPTEPVVMTLPAIQHLHTPIDAVAQTHTRVLDLVAALHPTPAVSGTPREEAMQWLSKHEKFDRGWYAAPVGWATPAGSGEFRVALRCALLSPSDMTLFAGGGIVAGANAHAELAETATKFEALLSVSQAAPQPTSQSAARAAQQTA